MADLEQRSEAATGRHTYAALLGLRTFDSVGLQQKVADGLPYQALERLQSKLDVPMRQLAELLQIRMRTLHRRKQEGRLQPDESDRLLRTSRLVGRTLDLFEDDLSAARQWLSAPQRGLGGATPLEFARTDIGLRDVEELIGRLEHGVVS